MRIGQRLQVWIVGVLLMFALFLGAGRADAQLRIMPLGDSITDGANVPGGYRIKLWEYFGLFELDATLVGSLTNGPPKLGARNHEGHSGWRIDQIAARIDEWLDTEQPEIILLHIGTNDCNQNYQFASIGDRFSALIDQITDRAPDSLLVVALVTPSSNPTVNARIEAYNELVHTIMDQKLKEGRWVGLVDMYTAGVSLADSLHPDRAGYDVMADVWMYFLWQMLWGG